MSWTYSQDDGRLYDPNGVLAGTGYAGGNEGANPEGVNNHDMQNVKSIGPLPCGTYRMGDVIQQSHLGVFAIPLIPDAANEMFGRGGFFCHGDTKEMNQSASQGCIIQSRAVRNELDASDDKQIEVVEHHDPA